MGDLATVEVLLSYPHKLHTSIRHWNYVNMFYIKLAVMYDIY